MSIYLGSAQLAGTLMPCIGTGSAKSLIGLEFAFFRSNFSGGFGRETLRERKSDTMSGSRKFVTLLLIKKTPQAVTNEIYTPWNRLF